MASGSGHKIDYSLVRARQLAFAVAWADDQVSDRFTVVGQRPSLHCGWTFTAFHEAAGSPFNGHVAQPECLAQRIRYATKIIAS
jgi:hypothetical protein